MILLHLSLSSFLYPNNTFYVPITTVTDCRIEYDACKVPGGVSSPLFTGVMAFVMGIVTMIRVTRNMPKKLTNATIYSSPVYCDDTIVKNQTHLAHASAISGADYMSVLKRMAELEEKVTVLSMKPATMPPEKEEMLNAALSRVDALEQELVATKKVLVGFPKNFFSCIEFIAWY